MNIFKEYSEAKIAVKEAEERVKHLYSQVVDALLAKEDQRADLPEAKITLRTSISYKFSANVEKQQTKIQEIESEIEKKIEPLKKKLDLNKELLKSMQEEEISTKKAEELERNYVPVYTPVKVK